MARLPDKILVVRHGARLDETMPAIVFRDVAVGYDTPLTYGGFKQSQALGAHIAQLLLLPGNPDRRRKRIIIHSSPFTRCVQTSIGIAAGMAQIVAPTTSEDHLMTANQTPSSFASPYEPITLRIDPWLGEWMTEQYFEHWDAALLRSSEISARARRLLCGQADAEGIRVEVGDRKATDIAMTSASPLEPLPMIPVVKDTRRTYQPPVPNHAVLSSDAIPAGYVAHARNACIDFDETWVGLRDGGIYGERWSAFHARLGAGLLELLQWYLVHRQSPRSAVKEFGQRSADTHRPSSQNIHGVRLNGQLPDTDSTATGMALGHKGHLSDVATAKENRSSMKTLANEVSTECLQDPSPRNGFADARETEEELVIILVTHAGGCNKLLHFLTQKPVLIDFPPSSLIMAIKSPSYQSAGQLDSLAKQYQTVLQASTDHLKPSATFRTIKELAMMPQKVTRHSRSSSRSNRRTTVTSMPTVSTVVPMGLWGQSVPHESGSVSASVVTEVSQSGLWRPNGGMPLRRATLDNLNNLTIE